MILMAKANVMPDEDFPYEKLALRKATPKNNLSAHPLYPLSKMHAIKESLIQTQKLLKTI